VLVANCAPPAADERVPILAVRQIASNAAPSCRRPFGFGVFDREANATTVCWNGKGMSVYVRRYDHARRAWGEARLIRENDWTGRWSYHNYPVMVLAPDGHLLVFFFEHSHRPHVLRSPRPHAVDGPWTEPKLPADRNAYPMPIICGDTVYLFYSRSDNVGEAYRTYRYVKSADSGRTWSKPRTAIDSQQRVPGRYDEVYAIDYHVTPARGDRPTRVQLTWQMHGGGGHNRGTRNNYFAYFLPADETFRSADGTNLGAWIDYEEMDGTCMVEAAEEPRGHPLGYATTSTSLADGTPLVLYRYYRQVRIARWDGDMWRKQAVTLPRTGDITTADDGTVRVLGSRGGRQLFLSESTDGGRTWRMAWSGDVPHANGSDGISNRGFIANHHPDLPAMACCIDRSRSQSNYQGLWPVVVVQAREDAGHRSAAASGSKP
jgi:hypothetical protein